MKIPKQCQSFAVSRFTRLRGLLGGFRNECDLSVAVRPDGNVFLQHDDDDVISVIDPGTGEIVEELECTFPLDVAPDGSYVTWDWAPEGGQNKLFRIWRNAEAVMDIPAVGDGYSAWLAGDHLLAEDNTGKIVVFDAGSGEQVAALDGHTKNRFGKYSICLAVLSCGTRIVTSDGVSFRLWNLKSGKLESEHQGPEGFEARQVLTSPDDRFLVFSAVREDKWTEGSTSLHVWNLESFEPVRMIEGHEGFVRLPIYLRGGELLVTTATDATVRLWCVADWSCIESIDISDTKDDIGTLHALPGGGSFIGAGERGAAYLWDVSWPEEAQ